MIFLPVEETFSFRNELLMVTVSSSDGGSWAWVNIPVIREQTKKAVLFILKQKLIFENTKKLHAASTVSGLDGEGISQNRKEGKDTASCGVDCKGIQLEFFSDSLCLGVFVALCLSNSD